MTDADLYEVLGVRQRRLRRRAEAGLPGQGPRVPPRRQPGRRRQCRAVQRGQPGLRGAEGPRAPGPLRPLRGRGGLRPRLPAGRRRRPVRRRARRPVRRLLQRHGRGRRRRPRPAHRPVPGPDAEMVLRLSFREAVFGVQREVEVADAGPLRHLRGLRGPARHLGRPLPRVPGGGRASPGAPVHPRPGHHCRAVPAVPGHRPVHPEPRAPTAGARAGGTSSGP